MSINVLYFIDIQNIDIAQSLRRFMIYSCCSNAEAYPALYIGFCFHLHSKIPLLFYHLHLSNNQPEVFHKISETEKL
jgi:NADH:ubiquinone oxidoreductase subunit